MRIQRSLCDGIATGTLVGSVVLWALSPDRVNAQAMGDTGEPSDLLTRFLILVVPLCLIAAVAIWWMRRREEVPGEMGYEEHEIQSSKFERLLAEIQGLHLRTKSGESKGTYRKIDMLARVFLERLGHEGAREMDDQQIHDILKGGSLTENQSTRLRAIFEHCQEESQRRDAERLNVTTADLLIDLRALVQEMEDPTKTERS